VDFDRNIWAFDTSGLNSLFDEPEKHSFLEMFRTTVVPAISVLNLLEIQCTGDYERQAGLVKMVRDLDPLFLRSPIELLRELAQIGPYDNDDRVELHRGIDLENLPTREDMDRQRRQLTQQFESILAGLRAEMQDLLGQTMLRRLVSHIGSRYVKGGEDRRIVPWLYRRQGGTDPGIGRGCENLLAEVPGVACFRCGFALCVLSSLCGTYKVLLEEAGPRVLV
jgi:hypothetical protein